MFMRGFVIAVDALVSLAVLFVIISLAFDAASGPETSLRQENLLRVYGEHAAFTLEQSQLLMRGVILNNTTNIRAYLSGWPSSICGSVSVFPSPDVNTPTFIVTKSGCTLNSPQTEVVRHSFMVPSPPDVNMYIMEVSTWPGSP